MRFLTLMGLFPRTSTTDKDKATTVETQTQSNAVGMGANIPNTPQDATQQDPIMAKSDEERESKTTDFEISRQLTETVQEPGAIIGRSVVVLIAKGETPLLRSKLIFLKSQSLTQLELVSTTKLI